MGLLATACRESLLHDEYVVEVVPGRVLGARPYYTTAPQPAPAFVNMPDTLSPGGFSIGDYTASVVPYEGVALWRSVRVDTVPDGFLAVPGLLDFSRRAGSAELLLTRATDAYVLGLPRGRPPEISPVSATPPSHPYRFLSQTLRWSGRSRPYIHIECPDTTRVLAGFRLDTLESPSCTYE